jgi:hypothetical protein
MSTVRRQPVIEILVETNAGPAPTLNCKRDASSRTSAPHQLGIVDVQLAPCRERASKGIGRLHRPEMG